VRGLLQASSEGEVNVVALDGRPPGRGREREPHRVLRVAVRESGRSLEQAALELGVSRSTFFRWLTGELRPRIRNAVRLERVFNIPVTAWDQASDDDGEDY
jgi:DNA-binding XRE family transcriptional regulator